MEQNKATKMWSDRFRDPLDSTFEAWQRSFSFDFRLRPQEATASKAYICASARLLP